MAGQHGKKKKPLPNFFIEQACYQINCEGVRYGNNYIAYSLISQTNALAPSIAASASFNSLKINLTLF